MNIREIINALNGGEYNAISTNADKKMLSNEDNITIDNNIFPLECVESWPEPRIADFTQMNLIVKMLLFGIENIMKVNKNCSILKSVKWHCLENIIKYYICKNELINLKDLGDKISVLTYYEIDLNFDFSNLLVHTNNEIYKELIKILDEGVVLKFISNIRRDKPTLENSFMNHYIGFSDVEYVQSISADTHYMPTDVKFIASLDNLLEFVPKRFNEKHNNILQDLGDLLDGVNAVLTGGSVFDCIYENDKLVGKDIDIFCTPEGFKLCYDRIKLIYNNIILFTQHNSCVNLLIPGQCKTTNMIIQFIVTSSPVSRVIGSTNNIGFDFEHLKLIMAFNKLYVSYNALLCLKTGETYIANDVSGCILPHRFAKICKRFPFRKSSAVEEYSGQLIGKIIQRDLKYIYFDINESTDRIDFLLRKIHSLKKSDFVINTIDKTAYYIDNHNICERDNESVIFDIIKNIIVLNITELNKLSLKSIDIGQPEVKEFKSIFDSRPNNYSAHNPIMKSPIYKNNSGLIPPVIIDKIKHINNKHIIIVRKFQQGTILDSLFGNCYYLELTVESDIEKFKEGQVVYCVIKNMSNIISTNYYDINTLSKLGTASSIIRYSDLEDYVESKKMAIPDTPTDPYTRPQSPRAEPQN
jgi:hypothetical protein